MHHISPCNPCYSNRDKTPATNPILRLPSRSGGVSITTQALAKLGCWVCYIYCTFLLIHYWMVNKVGPFDVRFFHDNHCTFRHRACSSSLPFFLAIFSKRLLFFFAFVNSFATGLAASRDVLAPSCLICFWSCWSWAPFYVRQCRH